MKRFVLRERESGKFYLNDATLVTSPIDALIFSDTFVPRILNDTKTGYDLCAVEFAVNSVDPVKVGEL